MVADVAVAVAVSVVNDLLYKAFYFVYTLIKCHFCAVAVAVAVVAVADAVAATVISMVRGPVNFLLSFTKVNKNCNFYGTQ